jgi:hypothetical protein
VPRDLDVLLLEQAMLLSLSLSLSSFSLSLFPPPFLSYTFISFFHSVSFSLLFAHYPASASSLSPTRSPQTPPVRPLLVIFPISTSPGQSASALAKIKSLWNPKWSCPALALGDHSGALDASEYDDWLVGARRNYTISGDSLLRRGRGGLRVGSWQTPSDPPSPADRVLEPSTWRVIWFTRCTVSSTR